MFGCYLEIFKLNSSHDALATRDINRTKIVFYKFGIHDFGAAYINRGIIMKKSCSEEEIRQKSCFQIRQNTIYYTNRVLPVLINCENTIFARFYHDFSTICFEKFLFGKCVEIAAFVRNTLSKSWFLVNEEKSQFLPLDKLT